MTRERTTPGEVLHGAETSLLPPAMWEFVVIADTHHMLEGADHGKEFPSRARQNERIERSLAVAKSLDPRFCLHLGDHVQDYPGSATYDRTLEGANAQIDSAGMRFVHVAGNTDVGDKPDPASPGREVDVDGVATYEAAFGPSWFAFDEDGVRFVVLNASLLNSTLAAAAEQRLWLDAELTGPRQRRVVCLHYPLYLDRPDDTSMGNYDVVAEPARSELIEAFADAGVELVLSGHSHWLFTDHTRKMRLVVAPSTSFTRPGFSEMFSSAAPSERGRNDVPKLGVMLARVHDDEIRLHVVRTGSASSHDRHWKRVVTPVPNDRADGRLEVVLRHPVTSRSMLPVAFPSVVPQPVRNDYPLFALIELGAAAVRVPVEHLADPVQRSRLRVLREHGVQTHAVMVGPAAAGPADWLDAEVRLVEYQGAATGLPPTDHHHESRRAPLLFEKTRPGFELPRARQAYLVEEIPDDADGFDRVVVQLTPDLIEQLLSGNQSVVQRLTSRPVDVMISLGDLETAGPDAHGSEMAQQLATMVLAAATVDQARVMIDPLVELDRTMDRIVGLLDRACNPTPLFHVVRILTAILGERATRWSLAPATGALHSDDGRVLSLASAQHHGSSVVRHDQIVEMIGSTPDGTIRCHDLVNGMVRRLEPGMSVDLGQTDGPVAYLAMVR